MALTSAAAASKGLSKRSAGVRRLLQEAAELAEDADPTYSAEPLEDDLFTWHYTLRPGGDFEGGAYHGKMVLPSEYPFKPPEVYVLTPSGRFEVNKKICLSISSFHPETWQPSWGIRTALIAIMAFFATEAKGAVGSLEAPPAERKRLAAASWRFKCSTCGYDAADAESPTALPRPSAEETKTEAKVAVKEKEVEVRVVEEAAEVISEAPTPSISPPPPDSDDGEPELETASLPSVPPTTIFPSSANSTTPSLPNSRGPLSPRHRVSAPSPSRSAACPTTSSAPHHPHHHATHHHFSHPPPLVPPGAPRLSPAHLPPSPNSIGTPTPNPLRAAAADSLPAPVPPAVTPAPPAQPPVQPEQHIQHQQQQQLVLPPGVSLAQVIVGETGGPPQWVDRAILAVLLALVAAVVRKIA